MNPNIRPEDRALYEQRDFVRDSELPFDFFHRHARTGEWLMYGAIAVVILLVALYLVSRL